MSEDKKSWAFAAGFALYFPCFMLREFWKIARVLPAVIGARWYRWRLIRLVKRVDKYWKDN